MSSSESPDERVVRGDGDGPPLVTGGGVGSMDGDSLRRSLAAYRYENALIKTELAATLERHGREVEELRLKFESKVREVERQRRDLQEQLSHMQQSQVEKESRLHQTSLHLQHKIKALEEDLATSTQAWERLQREKTQVEEELEKTRLSRETTEQKLKAENDRLAREGEHLRKDVEKEREALREVTATLTSERHQHQLIKSRVSEVEQQCRVQLTLVEGQVAQLRQEKAEEEAAGTRRLKEVMGMLEEERARATKVREGVAARQKETERRAAEERQTHLSSIQQLSTHNAELHQEVKTLEDKLQRLEEEGEGRGKGLKEELRLAMEKLQVVEKEAAVAEVRVAGLEDLERVLKQERESCSSLRQEVQRSRSEVEELRAKNGELHQDVMRLSKAQSQHEAAREEVRREESNRVRMVADLRTSHQKEAERLRGRISTLETYLAEKSAKYQEDSTQLHQKLRTYARLIKKLRHKLECGALQLESLEAQRVALEEERGGVPASSHAHLQAQLQALTRKHNEFSTFLCGLGKFQSSLPEVAELNNSVGALHQKIADMETDQRQCFSDLDSL